MRWGGGTCLSSGVSVQGDLCPGGGLSLSGRSLSRGGLCPGVSPSGGICPGGLCPRGSPSGRESLSRGSLSGRVSVQRGLCQEDPQTETTPPPLDRMTDSSKNINLPQTSFAGGKYTKCMQFFLNDQLYCY